MLHSPSHECKMGIKCYHIRIQGEVIKDRGIAGGESYLLYMWTKHVACNLLFCTSPTTSHSSTEFWVGGGREIKLSLAPRRTPGLMLLGWGSPCQASNQQGRLALGFLWGRLGMRRVATEQCLTFTFCDTNCFSLTFQTGGDFPLIAN